MFLLDVEQRCTCHRSQDQNKAEKVSRLESNPSKLTQPSQIKNGQEPRIGVDDNRLDLIVDFVAHSTVPSDLRKRKDEEEDNIDIILHVVHVEHEVRTQQHQIVFIPLQREYQLP